MAKKRLLILGSTGSIGTTTLNIITDEINLVGLGANSNKDLLLKQVQRFNVKKYATPENNGFIKLIDETNPDIVLNAVSGTAGLKYSIEILKRGIDLALANKESLVMGGKQLIDLSEKKNAKIIPVDSEHSAIYQLKVSYENINKIYITGSGGPFLNYPINKFNSITPDMALNHPKWKMGKKITIDSATLMNKGLEVIEAYYLFNLRRDQIEVIINPESIIHGMIELNDGSVLSQMANPDMSGPIAYAIFGEKRIPSLMKQIDFIRIKKLNFLKPDIKKFPFLKLAYDLIDKDSSRIAMNTVNEYFVNEFLNKKIKFPEIYSKTIKVINEYFNRKINSLDDILDLDEEIRWKIAK